MIVNQDYNLEFELNNWIILKNIFNNINEISDEIIIECNDNGLKFNGIDRGHICFFEGEISKELFDKYVLSNVLDIYMNLDEFVKVLKRGKNKDTLVFKANSSKFDVIFKDRNTRTFSITQIDDVTNSKSPPKLDYSVDFVCDFDTIKDSLKDAELYSDRLAFIVEDNVLTLDCDNDMGDYKNECILNESVSGSYSATYSIDWLLKIFNNKLSSDNLKINMGDDYPMLIETNMEYINMNYLLAPRIEN